MICDYCGKSSDKTRTIKVGSAVFHVCERCFIELMEELRKKLVNL